jgi:hypothetical protein
MDALATATDRLPGTTTVVVLDRYDDHHEIHRRNRAWLSGRNGYRVVVAPGEESLLAALVTGATGSTGL